MQAIIERPTVAQFARGVIGGSAQGIPTCCGRHVIVWGEEAFSLVDGVIPARCILWFVGWGSISLLSPLAPPLSPRRMKRGCGCSRCTGRTCLGALLIKADLGDWR